MAVAAPAPPRHVAIVMDGNGRWAQQRRRPRTWGHKVGIDAVKRVTRHAAERGIEALTLFAFSSENWSRPAPEVGRLFELLLQALRREAGELGRFGVQLNFIGELARFAPNLRAAIVDAVNATAHGTGLKLNVALNYGGRWDLWQAARKAAADLAAGRMTEAEFDIARFGQYVSLADLPEPDLFIRTGGELRISNFLLWQLAYTELYFTDTLWPDFNEAAFDAALAEYGRRHRRFGLTAQQVDGLQAEADHA